eukprot:1136537-Pelagomonas_calceolata.AAC.8
MPLPVLHCCGGMSACFLCIILVTNSVRRAKVAFLHQVTGLSIIRTSTNPFVDCFGKALLGEAVGQQLLGRGDKKAGGEGRKHFSAMASLVTTKEDDEKICVRLSCISACRAPLCPNLAVGSHTV